MSIRIHPQAHTSSKVRQEIKELGLSDHEAAKVFNITRATATKWLKRDDVQQRGASDLIFAAVIYDLAESVANTLMRNRWKIRNLAL